MPKRLTTAAEVNRGVGVEVIKFNRFHYDRLWWARLETSSAFFRK